MGQSRRPPDAHHLGKVSTSKGVQWTSESIQNVRKIQMSSVSAMLPLSQRSLWELWLSRNEKHASEIDAILRKIPNTLYSAQQCALCRHSYKLYSFCPYISSLFIQIGTTTLLRT